MHSQRHGNYGKSAHANINVVVILAMILCDVYVSAEFKNPDTSINAVSLEQHNEGYTCQMLILSQDHQSRAGSS